MVVAAVITAVVDKGVFVDVVERVVVHGLIESDKRVSKRSGARCERKKKKIGA